MLAGAKSALTEPPRPDALSYRFTYGGKQVETDSGAHARGAGAADRALHPPGRPLRRQVGAHRTVRDRIRRRARRGRASGRPGARASPRPRRTPCGPRRPRGARTCRGWAGRSGSRWARRRSRHRAGRARDRRAGGAVSSIARSPPWRVVSRALPSGWTTSRSMRPAMPPPREYVSGPDSPASPPSPPHPAVAYSTRRRAIAANISPPLRPEVRSVTEAVDYSAPDMGIPKGRPSGHPPEKRGGTGR